MGRVFVRLWVGYLRDGCSWRGLDVRHRYWCRGQGLLSGRLGAALRR